MVWETNNLKIIWEAERVGELVGEYCNDTTNRVRMGGKARKVAVYFKEKWGSGTKDSSRANGRSEIVYIRDFREKIILLTLGREW